MADKNEKAAEDIFPMYSRSESAPKPCMYCAGDSGWHEPKCTRPTQKPAVSLTEEEIKQLALEGVRVQQELDERCAKMASRPAYFDAVDSALADLAERVTRLESWHKADGTWAATMAERVLRLEALVADDRTDVDDLHKRVAERVARLERFVLGKKCTDQYCPDYDGEHPYHDNVMVRGHTWARKDMEHLSERLTALEQKHNDLFRAVTMNTGGHRLALEQKAAPEQAIAGEYSGRGPGRTVNPSSVKGSEGATPSSPSNTPAPQEPVEVQVGQVWRWKCDGSESVIASVRPGWVEFEEVDGEGFMGCSPVGLREHATLVSSPAPTKGARGRCQQWQAEKGIPLQCVLPKDRHEHHVFSLKDLGDPAPAAAEKTEGIRPEGVNREALLGSDGPGVVSKLSPGASAGPQASDASPAPLLVLEELVRLLKSMKKEQGYVPYWLEEIDAALAKAEKLGRVQCPSKYVLTFAAGHLETRKPGVYTSQEVGELRAVAAFLRDLAGVM